MKSLAVLVLVFILVGSFASSAQTKTDKDADKNAVAAKPSKTDVKKDETKQSNCKGGGQECPPHTEEKKPG